MVVVDKSTDHDKTHINLFFTTISTPKKIFFSERKQLWTLIDNGLVIFDWFVLSMRTQVILDSSFRPPGFSPYMRWEERRVQGLDYLLGGVD